ncbi:MAG: hypothetical protein EHM23_29440 [Acidobacteria bacterium]|nr:MAG: hypothetical protein EHM23_29440 [Acidobacteriota bacterium]
MRHAWRVFVFSSFLLEALNAAITYPQVAVGGGYRSILILSNQSGQEWHGKLKAYTGNAEPWNVDWKVADAISTSQPVLAVTIPGDATKKIEVQGDNEIAVGYLVLESDAGYFDSSLAASFFYNLVGNGDKLQDSTGIPPGEKGTAFTVAVERSEAVNTGIAWAPSGSVTPFNVQARLVGVDGQVFQQKELLFEGHRARFFTEMFDSVPENFLGKLTLESPQSFNLTALRVEIGDAIQLTSTPPQRVTTAAARPLELDQSSFWFRKHHSLPNTWEVSGKIRNHSSEDVIFPQLAFAAQNANGALVGGDYSFLRGPARQVDTVITNASILAGEEGYFYVRFSTRGAPESFDFVIFALDFRETSQPAGNVVASEYQIKDASGNLRLEAQLQNTGTKTVKLEWITAFLFDEQDRVLTMALGKADKEQLAPGEKASFAENTLTRTTSVKRVFFSPSWEDVGGQAAALTASQDAAVSPEEALLKLRRRYEEKSGKMTSRVVGKITVRASE